MSLLVSLLVGILASSLIGFAAYRRNALTRGGFLGAILTGTLIFGFGGFVPGFLLVTFFISSTVLSRYKAHAKQEVGVKFQKGSRRDLGQTLANGGWAALMSIGYWFAGWAQHDERARLLFFAGFVGAIATVTADTWATEVGVLSKALPRMITNRHIVPAGTSGAITALGTFTAFAGALLIGLLASLIRFPLIPPLSEILAGAPPDLSASIDLWLPNVLYFELLGSVAGLAGALFDSVLGATVQAVYFSEYDERQTEKKYDSQGSPTRRVRGWDRLDNDWVNFLASVLGSLVAVVLAFFIL